MCFDPLAMPPVAAASPPAAFTERLVASSRGEVRVCEARGATRASDPAVVVLPDGRGLHPYYEQLACRFAEAGIHAVAVDHFVHGSNDASSAGPRPRVRWPHVVEGLAQVAGDLRADVADRPVFVVGFCLGGRMALLAASEPTLDIAGVIALYGQPAGESNHDIPAPVEHVAAVRCPILGLYGGADELVPQASVRAYVDALTARDIRHETVIYPGAPHSFFDRRSDEFAVASADVWSRTLAFLRGTDP